MTDYEFMQSYKSINNHDGIVLRTPTLSTGERMLNVYFKNQTTIMVTFLNLSSKIARKKFKIL